jgi:Fe-S oxidoreductase
MVLRKGKGFCCGAGGARMWLEERTGKRINEERIDEALALDPGTVSTACPYCMVMLGDAVNAKKAAGQAKESLEVIDVSQLLVRAIKLREASEAQEAAATTGPVPESRPASS